jgi:tellurite resistance protein TerC
VNIPTADPERLQIPLWVWAATTAVMAALLIFDVLVIARRPRVPSTREVGGALAFYVGAALVFGLGLWWFTRDAHGTTFVTEYYAGWLTEYSLSVDNLFIFVLIMARFGVPEKLQQSALMIGIMIAILLRGVFIAAGAAAINQFSWVFYAFGAFLIYTAVKLVTERDQDGDDVHEKPLMAWVQRRFPAHEGYHGAKLFTRVDGVRLATPMLVVILALGTTDLLFALDSIPAIYGLTKEPYLVLTANLFALMGLRQLYFLIGGLLRRLVYLSVGLAVLLAFIGAKLMLHALHENALPFVNGGEPVTAAPDLPISVSLGAIVVILGATTTASLWKTRREASRDVSAP